MDKYENESYLKKKLNNKNKTAKKNIYLFNTKLIHKLFDSINISLLTLIFILTFLSFNSQRKWTNFYINLAKTRAKNNNLIDYISKTEEFYIQEIESLNTLKKTTPKDLIYFDKQINDNSDNYLIQKIKYILDGLKDSQYRKGY